jgi:hypothetical protein
MAVLPLVMTPQGLQPAAPSDLRAALIALVAATNPDYTANLPGTLIEDIASTDTFALVESDSFLVDLVNSVTPLGANPYLLNQLGILYGVDKQPITNTAVYVIFSGPPGYVISQGFVVSDGTYQYICQTSGVCGIDGNSLLMYALATQEGSWEVLPNTVVQMITSVPANIPLSVTNPISGIPSLTGEPISVFRERCWTAGLAASTGMGRYLKTLCGNVPGVQNRLVSVQTVRSQYVVIVGGGDPYQVANAIWQADFNVPGLTGATIEITNISNSNPAIVTCANNHNLLDGDIETIIGVVGMIGGVTNTPYPITTFRTAFPSSLGSIPDKQFTIPVDTTNSGLYAYGGIVTPNPINVEISISDFPDTYVVPFVIPPQELVSMTVVWITDSPNYVSPDAIAQAAVSAIIDYINSLPAGTTPINLNVLNKVFLDAVSMLVVGEFIIDLEWSISINGIPQSPAGGTQAIFGDPYSYFYTENSLIQILGGIR